METRRKSAETSKSTGTSIGTKRKRGENMKASRETPSKPRKKQVMPVDLENLAADDDGEIKEQVKEEIEQDEEMEDEGRNAEEA